jgi:hypothetical protein
LIDLSCSVGVVDLVRSVAVWVNWCNASLCRDLIVERVVVYAVTPGHTKCVLDVRQVVVKLRS